MIVHEKIAADKEANELIFGFKNTVVFISVEIAIY